MCAELRPPLSVRRKRTFLVIGWKHRHEDNLGQAQTLNRALLHSTVPLAYQPQARLAPFLDRLDSRHLRPPPTPEGEGRGSRRRVEGVTAFGVTPTEVSCSRDPRLVALVLMRSQFSGRDASKLETLIAGGK